MVVVVFMWVCKGRTITSISAVVGARQIVERESERAYITSWWEGRIVNGVRISAATEQPRVRADEGGGWSSSSARVGQDWERNDFVRALNDEKCG
jgi:hypothetical protein